MRYVINFQVKFYEKPSNISRKKRATYTITDQEVHDNNLNNIEDVYNWFIIFFNNNPCDLFINNKDIKNVLDLDLFKLKIGRITDSKTGDYKTF